MWALTAFLGISAILPGATVSRRAAIALAIAYGVELSQLYHAPWIDGLRRTTLGGLFFGFGFLWSDLVCYSVGVASGVVLERLVVRLRARIAREVN